MRKLTPLLMVFAVSLAVIGMPTAATAQYYVLQLEIKNRWDNTSMFHFMPPDGFSRNACQKWLPAIVDEYNSDVRAALIENYRMDLDRRHGFEYVAARCANLPLPPGQLMNLRISGVQVR